MSEKGNWLRPLWHLAQMYGCKPYVDEEAEDIARWRAELIEGAQNGGRRPFVTCRREMLTQADRMLESGALREGDTSHLRMQYLRDVFHQFRPSKFRVLASGTWPDDLTPGI